MIVSKRNFVVPILLCIVFSISFAVPSFAQVTISGTVYDSITGETLPFAHLIVNENENGGITNKYGFFSITSNIPVKTMNCSYIGYITKTINDIGNTTSLQIALSPVTRMIDEVVVTSKSSLIVKNQEKLSKIDITQIKQLPSAFGEADLLRNIQLLPGVNNTGELSTSYNVRGGHYDQNLILLDEAPILNGAHLFGAFSVVNPDVIKDAKFYKSGIPAKYGGQLSSVLDIVQKDGDLKNFRISGGIGLLASRLNVEGPIVKNKASFLIGARRSYADFFLGQFKDRELFNASVQDIVANFYDINAKVNVILNPRNRLFLSGYTGKDQYNLNESDLPGGSWGNNTATMRWNHLFAGNKLFLNSSIIYSEYGLNVISDKELYLEFKGGNGFKKYQLKNEFSFHKQNHTIDFGFDASLYHFLPEKIAPIDKQSFINSKALNDEYAINSAIYLSDVVNLLPNLEIMAGVRLSCYNLLGPATLFEYDKDASKSPGLVTDTVLYKKNNIITWDIIPEPRVSLVYSLNAYNHINLAYDKMSQNIHMISNTTIPTPINKYKPGNKHIKPLTSHQFSLGYSTFVLHQINLTSELYYKKTINNIDYKSNADLFLNEHIDTYILQGLGRVFGTELLIEKAKGSVTGHIAYTYSRATQKFSSKFPEETINQGEYHPAIYDIPHKLTLVSNLQITNRLKASAVFNYQTGRPLSLPDQQYRVLFTTFEYYSARNQYRLPDYHRLDISLTYTGKPRPRLKTSWNLSVYNLYGRDNVYSIYFRQHDGSNNTEAVEISIFSTVIPSLVYNMYF